MAPASGAPPSGWGRKLHLVTERGGKPIVAPLTEGQRHESPQVIPLLERMTARLWPEAVAGHKGYSCVDLRPWLRQREIAAVIPYRVDEIGAHEYERALYHERPAIERTINLIKPFRRVATRYDKQASQPPKAQRQVAERGPKSINDYPNSYPKTGRQ